MIVGMQNDLFDPQGFFCSRRLIELQDEEREGVLKSINSLAGTVRRVEGPVVQALWQLRPDHLNASYSVQWKRLGLREAGALVKGSWGAEPTPGLTREADDFILPVSSHSAFQFTNLDRILRNCEVDTCVVVGGAATDAVEDTIRHGASFGYRMLLPIDAIYPASNEHLKRLTNRADITTTSDLLNTIRAGAEPELRPVGGG